MHLRFIKDQPGLNVARRVVCVLPTAQRPARRTLRGIRQYANHHGPWDLRVLEPNAVPGELDSAPVDGVVGTLDGKCTLLPRLFQMGSPLVTVSEPPRRYRSLPWVTMDVDALADLVVEHLAGRGYRQLAYVGVRSESSRRRHLALRRAVRRVGGTLHALGSPADTADFDQRLRDWLTTLRPPLGVFAYQDTRAEAVFRACDRLGLAVPDEVAVLGMENDEDICLATRPTLSSVLGASVEIGWQAAALLDRLMRGEAAPTGPVLCRPERLVQRQSTVGYVFEDPDIATAVRFIQDQAQAPLTVEQVLETQSVSRPTFIKRFRAATGKTPQRAILDARLLAIKHQLAETRQPLAEVAVRCGFATASHLCNFFRREAGCTPTAYRQSLR